jgi:hypothetical protein
MGGYFEDNPFSSSTYNINWVYYNYINSGAYSLIPPANTTIYYMIVGAGGKGYNGFSGNHIYGGAGGNGGCGGTVIQGQFNNGSSATTINIYVSASNTSSVSSYINFNGSNQINASNGLAGSSINNPLKTIIFNDNNSNKLIKIAGDGKIGSPGLNITYIWATVGANGGNGGNCVNGVNGGIGGLGVAAATGINEIAGTGGNGGAGYNFSQGGCGGGGGGGGGGVGGLETTLVVVLLPQIMVLLVKVV